MAEIRETIWANWIIMIEDGEKHAPGGQQAGESPVYSAHKASSA
jgi:hypothetical protein